MKQTNVEKINDYSTEGKIVNTSGTLRHEGNIDIMQPHSDWNLSIKNENVKVLLLLS